MVNDSRAFLAPGEFLDRVVRSVGRGFRPRGYRVIYWVPGVPASELDCYFSEDQRALCVEFQRSMYAEGFSAERYVVEYQPVSLTWLSGRTTDWHERRFVLVDSLTRAVPSDSVRDRVERPGGAT